MNKAQTVFNKIAGVQAEVYKKAKPAITSLLNARTEKEFRNVTEYLENNQHLLSTEEVENISKLLTPHERLGESEFSKTYFNPVIQNNRRFRNNPEKLI